MSMEFDVNNEGKENHSQQSNRAWDRRSRTIATMLVLAAPIAMVAPLAFAPMAAILGVIAAPYSDLRRLTAKGGWSLALFVAFIVWALLSALWSANPSLQPLRLAGGASSGLLLLAAFAWRPADASSLVVRKSIVVFAFVTAIIGLVEWIGRMPLHQLGHWGKPPSLLERAPMMGTAILVACMWSAIAILSRAGWRGVLAAVLLLVAALANSALSDLNAAVVATILAAIAFTASLLLGPIVLGICGYLAAAWLLAAPAVLKWLADNVDSINLPVSWEQRLAIWRVVPDEVLRSPIFGHGLNSFRVLSQTVRTAEGTMLPMHPHCFALHVWFDLGAIGVLLAAAALIALVHAGSSALRDQPLALAASTAALVSTFVIANVSYGAWAEWWVATMFFGGGMAIASRSPQRVGAGDSV